MTREDEMVIERLRELAQYTDVLISPGHRRACRDAASRLTALSSEREILRELLLSGTLSLTSFDGHCVRIDFPTREGAEALFEAISNG